MRSDCACSMSPSTHMAGGGTRPIATWNDAIPSASSSSISSVTPASLEHSLR